MADDSPTLEEGFDVDLSFAATTFSDDSGDGEGEAQPDHLDQRETSRPRSRHISIGEETISTRSKPKPVVVMAPLPHPMHRADTDSPSLVGFVFFLDADPSSPSLFCGTCVWDDREPIHRRCNECGAVA
jgi:hypothetical protein